MEARLRDLLLDIEDRIHQGTLGTLKVNAHTHLLIMTENQTRQLNSDSPVCDSVSR